MEILRIVLFTLLVTVGLGSIVGVVAAKQAVRKAKGQSKPLLTATERAIYSALFAMGLVCVLIGAFWLPRLSANTEANQGMRDGMFDMGMMDEEERSHGDYFEEGGSGDVVMARDEGFDDGVDDEHYIYEDGEWDGDDAETDSGEHEAAEDDAEESPTAEQASFGTATRTRDTPRASRSGGGVAVAVR